MVSSSTISSDAGKIKDIFMLISERKVIVLGYSLKQSYFLSVYLLVRENILKKKKS